MPKGNLILPRDDRKVLLDISLPRAVKLRMAAKVERGEADSLAELTRVAIRDFLEKPRQLSPPTNQETAKKTGGRAEILVGIPQGDIARLSKLAKTLRVGSLNQLVSLAVRRKYG